MGRILCFLTFHRWTVPLDDEPVRCHRCRRTLTTGTDQSAAVQLNGEDVGE